MSGFSAGGDMTVQMHVAFSKTIKGAGVMSGSPFWCAKGTLMAALGACMATPSGINIQTLVDKTLEYDAAGDIDPVENLELSRIYIYNGASDGTRDVATAAKVEDYYNEIGVDERMMIVNTDLNANHGFPTVNEGNLCGTASSPYINRCDWDGAFEMLNFLYFGNLVQPDRDSAEATGVLKEFDQREFFTLNPGGSSFDTEGLIYIPERCQDGQTQCRLHVVFHGCFQGRDSIDEQYPTRCGYNEVGDLNDIVMLYPQAVKSPLIPYNPNGCFDWWGYTDSNYAKQSGVQMSAIRQMIERVADIDMA